HYLRRADLRSRHVGASDGSQSAARAEGTAGADLPLHPARSLSGGAFLRSGGDHVSQAYRRVGADRKDLCLAAPPLQARPAVGGPAPGTEPRRAARPTQGEPPSAACPRAVSSQTGAPMSSRPVPPPSPHRKTFWTIRSPAGAGGSFSRKRAPPDDPAAAFI